MPHFADDLAPTRNAPTRNPVADADLVAWLERIATRYHRFHDLVSPNALVAEGFCALEAARRLFDPTRGVPLRAYAFSRIDGAMARCIGCVLRLRCRERPLRSPHPDLVTPAFEDEIIAADDRERARRVLEALESADASILSECYLDGRSLRALGRDRGVSYSTVRRWRDEAAMRARQSMPSVPSFVFVRRGRVQRGAGSAVE